MATADGELTLIFNGEIYNHAALRAELKSRGHQFQTDHSDSEVLLHGYREWGADMPRRLNGMWAFAIHDPRNETLFCSRDRFGKKPFFYAATGKSFVFASELTAVTEHPGVSRTLSRRALQKYYAYGYIPAPLSIYEQVRKLPGGCSLTLNTRTLQFEIDRYWDLVLEPFDTIPKNPEAEWGEQIRHLLDAAVQRRLMSDVPLGVFLSGGIDSSAVTALAAKHLPRGQLKTFSVGFDEKSFDESQYARQVAELYGTDHHTETLSLGQAHTLLDECLAKLDEPLGDGSLLPTYLLNRFTRKHVTVALGGDGGDELFAGYDPFQALQRAQLYQSLIPQPIHAGIRALFDRLPVSHANMSLGFQDQAHAPRPQSPAAILAPDVDVLARPGRAGAALRRAAATRGALLRSDRAMGGVSADEPRRQDAPVLHKALPAGRHHGEGRPREHDARPRGARAVSRHRAGRLRPPHPEQLQAAERHHEIHPQESARARFATRYSLPLEEGIRQPDRHVVQERHTATERPARADASAGFRPRKNGRASRRQIG
jgi:asparagine synthase (glutamine-hydrolysing)